MTIGILGSGQLSQMMVQASRKSGIPVRILAGSKNDSAAREGGEVFVGKVSDSSLMKIFYSGLDAVAFESELVSIPSLRESAPAETQFIPDLEVMQLLSEKLEQKKLLEKLGIPTSPFEESPDSIQEISVWLKELQKNWGSFVLKWSKFGYDGRGVLIIQSESDLASAMESAAAALAKGTRLYAEQKVNFVRELAVIAVHARAKESTDLGSFYCYPLVISEQKGGACHWVRGPATSLGVKSEFENRAREYAQTLAESLDLDGAFAIEMFETQEGELWVNEIAPRVHNSGHYSQDACDHDQFEMHLIAVQGRVLPAVACAPFFAMLNLLGPPEVKGNFVGIEKSLPQPHSGLVLHWYQKDDVFPGRKLGHVNATAKSQEELNLKIEELKTYEENWIDFLKGLKS